MCRKKYWFGRSAVFTCLILTILVLLTAYAGAEVADERTDASGRWKYTVEAGSATITGSVVYPSGDLVIPSELDGNVVIRIGDEAFLEREYLTGVTIPDSVTSIGDWAFSGCIDLASVTIPDSVTSMGKNPFAFCLLTDINVATGNPVYEQIDGVLFDKQQKALIAYPHYREDSYAIPDGILRIGDKAFAQSLLSGVNIPDSVMSIGDNAFQGCKRLVRLSIPHGVTNIGKNPFANCPLTAIDISPDNPIYEQIDGVLFDKRQKVLVAYPGAKAGAYAVPQEVLLLGDWAFAGCSALTDVTIPDGVPSIGSHAFYRCSSLSSVNIPDSVTTIGDHAFFGCSSLSSVRVPDGVTTIAAWTFYGCNSLSSVIIPDSVTTIGAVAFSECSSLISITIPTGVTNIGGSAFSGCSSLTDITIPASVTNINDGLFGGCSSLTSITIPPGVTSIGFGAFSSCSNLASVTIPESVTSIDNWVFMGCSSLTDITIPDSVTTIVGNPFAVSALTSVNVSPDNPVYEQIDGVLFDKQQKMLVSYPCTREGAYTIPEGTLRIGDEAFSICVYLSDVAIPDSVTSIGSGAFYGCRELVSVTIPDSVSVIGDRAFANCGRLILRITDGVAEQYAQDNGIPYVLNSQYFPARESNP